MLPWILPIRIEDEVLANAFWITAIMTRPGARNSRNGRPSITRPPRPSASEKISRNIKRGHHRRRERLPGHLEEAPHLLEVERPQPDQVEIERRAEGGMDRMAARFGRRGGAASGPAALNSRSAT